MVNFYAFGLYRDKFFNALKEHRRGPDALHCLVDFDRSLKLPLDTPLEACRLPAEESLVSATPFRPLDLNLGEHDYNPFAYDVGCLGSMFQMYYSVRYRSRHYYCCCGTTRRKLTARSLNRTSFPWSQCSPPFSTR